MNFEHSDDRRMLADTLVRALRDGYPIETRNAGAYGEAGYDPAVWAQLNELGIVSALFDEAAGGFGGSGFDIMVVFEALEAGWNGEPVGPDDAATASPSYFNNRKLSIFGGSNEIQKNIISKAILGL